MLKNLNIEKQAETGGTAEKQVIFNCLQKQYLQKPACFLLDGKINKTFIDFHSLTLY